MGRSCCDRPAMSASSLLTVDIRSYGTDGGIDAHGFAQLVLPIGGVLDIEIDGRGSRLAAGHAAFVDRGMRHAQASGGANRSLIVDLDRAWIDDAAGDGLARQPFVALAPPANRLVDYMAALADGAGVSPATLRHWLPLLLDALTHRPPSAPSRLHGLLAAIEADPAGSWTAARMAEHAGMSVSRLHAVFRDERHSTPHAWLAALRLKRVQEWLAHSDRPIAEIAFRGGYSDQSALTRAMRRATGMTPAAYRRRLRETLPRNS